MKHLTSIIILIIISQVLFAQDKTAGNIKSLYDTKQYDQIINQYSSEDDYSAKSLYYIGLAYYMKQDDNNCVKFMDLSIDKDSTDPMPFYFKPTTLNYMLKYNEAVISFLEAIKIKDNDSKFYHGLGTSYYMLEKLDLALEAFKMATKQPNCPEGVYPLIAQIYSDQKNNEKALEAYYNVKYKIDKGSNSYLNALFNIGLLEIQKSNFDKAEISFLELTTFDPKDYHSFAKLIQIYTHKQEYDKAKPYKAILYQAQQSGQLPDNMKDMFCLDQFYWKNNLVQAYERYQESSSDIFNKHIFYVVNQDDQIICRIQTEFSPISKELGGPKYLLCRSKGTTHSTYNVGFNDNLNYNDLKNSVIDVLEEKIKPIATSETSK